MKRKDKARELIKTAVLGADKGLSSVAQTNPVLTILLTFLESILKKFFDYDKEERDKSADALKSLGKAEIRKLIGEQDKRLEKYSGMLADLTEEFCTSIKEIKERDSETLRFTKKDLLENIINRLEKNRESLSSEIQELKESLAEALAYIIKDPSECLVIPASPESEKETTLDLLRYSRQWIPLTGRDGEMKDLMEFADSPNTFSWWGIQGPGGCGKSRLALEWILKLKEKGWKDGFIRKDNARDDLNGFLSAANWLPIRDTAIVVDYGYEASDVLPGFIKDVANRLQGKECGKLRLLVLDRASSGESWWLTMMDRSSFEAKRAIEHTCFKTKPIKDKYGNIEKLEPILINIEKINSMDDQVRIIHNSIRKFKKNDSFPVPSAEELLPLTKHFAEARPLYLIMLGISIAQRGMDSVKDLSREEILDDFIKHEVGIWRKYFGEIYKIDQVASDIGFITLCNGLPSSALDKLPTTVCGQGKRDRDYRIKLKNILYAEKKEDGEEFINPLVPDILGERFVLTGGAGMEPYFNASDWIETCLEISPDGLGWMILRSFQDFDCLDIVSKWLDTAFVKIPDDYNDEIFNGFLLAISRLILICFQRGHKLEEREWFERHKNLAKKNIYSARLIAKLIIDMFTVFGSESRWSELEDWNGFLLEIRSDPQFRDDREIAFDEANAAFNAVTFYGRAQKWVDLERWGERIRAIRLDTLFKGDRDIALVEAMVAVNTISYYGPVQRWVELERWEKIITDLRELPEFKTDRDIALYEANAAFNAITFYGLAKKWADLERWGERIGTIRLDTLFKDDREIALQEVNAAINAISDYGSAQKWIELEGWGERIRTIRLDPLFKDDKGIALAEGRAAVNAIDHYGSAKKWVDMERWGERIKSIRLNPIFKNDQDIALREAMAAVNSVIVYGSAQKAIELERWQKSIINLREQLEFKTNREITLREAMAVVNAISYYGSVQKWIELEGWGERIKTIRLDPLFRDDREIALREAMAVVNAILDYGKAQKWIELEEWGERIKTIRLDPLFKDDREIALHEVNAAFNAIITYGSAHRWVELEEWGEKISTIRLDPLFRGDREIAFAEANAAVNTINQYGSAKKWIDLEQWGERIRTIRLTPSFKDDREIALEAAKAAANAIGHYTKERKISESSVWKDRAYSLYEDFSFDPEIIKICAESIAIHFLEVPDNSLGEILIDIAVHAPWIKSQIIQDTPFGILIPFLISKIIIISDDLYRKAKELGKQTKAVIAFCKQYPNYTTLPVINAKKLWQNRMFLDNWGKNLWGEIIKAGNAEWLKEALDDPWNSPEDRELLEKLLKEHTGNKE